MNASAETPPEPLPIQHVAAVEAKAELPWLVEGLWPERGVGFLGGHPKTCKSWLAFDVALSVASRTKALGRFSVRRGGPVLVFAAEDAPPMVRSRFSGMAEARGVSLRDAPIQLILANSLRLESDGDQARLRVTIQRHRPVLLILDPFVRMTAIDENSAQEVSRVLAFLRDLNRTYELAILVVHHVRKSATQSNRGLALRGSGDFWAWSDTNLYLSKKPPGLQLAIEHRSAQTPDPISLELCNDPESPPYLRVTEGAPPSVKEPVPLVDRVFQLLTDRAEPVRLDDVRSALRVRMQGVVNALRELEQQSRVERADRGWRAITDHEPGETEAGSAEAQPAEG